MSVTPGDSTGERILDAAERLFAERGVDGVSLRGVMTEAGTNVAAVRYHFGSKDDLIRALIARHQPQIARRRMELLAVAEQKGTVRAVAGAIVEPIVEVADSGGRAWVSVMSKLLATGDATLRRAMRDYQPQAERLETLLQRLRPGTNVGTLRFRVTEATALAFLVLGNSDQVNRLLAFSDTQLGPAEVNQHIRNTVTAILAGPPDER